MPDLIAAPAAPVAPPRRDRVPVLGDVVGKLQLNELRNDAAALRSPSDAARCRLAYSAGDYESMACADAMKSARNVMCGALDAQSGADAVALKRTVHLFGATSAEQVGPTLVENLTTLGAARAGVQELIREGKRTDLGPLLRRLDACIVDIGVKAGKCKGIPEAVLTDKASGQLCAAVRKGKAAMVECAGSVGGKELLRGIAQSILPRSITHAIQDRLSLVADKYIGPTAQGRLLDALQAQAAGKLEQRIVGNLNAGGPEALNAAILHVLKTAEYIIQGEPGGAKGPITPSNESKLPDDAPTWLRDLARANTPFIYNVAKNEVSDLAKQSHSAPLQMDYVRNLTRDAFRNGVAFGRQLERNRQLEHRVDQLERALKAARESNGAGLIRSEPLAQKVAQASEGVLPPGGELDPLWLDDVGQAHVRLQPSDPTAEESSRALQRQHSLRQASDNAIPADEDTDSIASGHNAWDFTWLQLDQADRNSQQDADALNGQGAQHLGRNQRSQEDESTRHTQGNRNHQLDRTDENQHGERQLHNASNEQLPPNGQLDDAARPDGGQRNARVLDQTHQSNRNQQHQRLGDGQQRVQARTDLHDARSSGGAAAGTSMVGEFVSYLQALGIEERPMPLDPFRPLGEWTMTEHDVEPDMQRPSANRTLQPGNAQEFFKARASRMGQPYRPFSTGPIRAPETAKLPELLDLIQRHGQENLAPGHVLARRGLAAVPPTPMTIREADSPLAEKFAALQDRKIKAAARGAWPSVAADHGRAPKLFMSPREEALLGPAVIRSVAAEFSRDSQPNPPQTASASADPATSVSTPVSGASRPARASAIPELARSVVLPSRADRLSAMRVRSASMVNAGSMLNPLAREIISNSRIPRAELVRQASVDETPKAVRRNDAMDLLVGENWEETSISADADGDAPWVITDADATEWAIPGSVDSGTESPTDAGPLEAADWDPTTLDRIDRVADRAPVDAKRALLDELQAVQRDPSRLTLRKTERLAS